MKNVLIKNLLFLSIAALFWYFKNFEAASIVLFGLNLGSIYEYFLGE